MNRIKTDGLPSDEQGGSVFDLRSGNKELMAAMQAEAEAAPVAGVTLDEIMALAQQQKVLEAEVTAAEAVLKKAVARLNDIAEDKLPNLMQGLGMTALELADGSKVTIKEDLKVFLTKANKERGHQWLRENGHGSVIKNVVGVSFDRGEDGLADFLLERLRLWKYNPAQSKEVNANTLKALIKEQKGKGVDIPEDIFSLFPYTKTVITEAK